MFMSPCCEDTGVIADGRTSMAPSSVGSLFGLPLSRSLAAAATCAHPSLWLRPSQSLGEQKQVLTCNAAIRAALAASCCAKMAALASLRSRHAVKNFWIPVEGQLKSHETHVKRETMSRAFKGSKGDIQKKTSYLSYVAAPAA